MRRASISVPLILVTTILGLWVALSAGSAAANSGVNVSGAVINRQQRPIPGLTVYLVNSAAGRSAPRTTDDSGRFLFSGVPARADQYFLEIYWGRDLLYRKPVVIDREKNLGTIML